MKKNIVIKKENENRINETIKAAEGRATVRTIDFKDIMSAISDIEKRLGIQKKILDGITAEIDYHAQDFPHAYKYRPESTHVALIHKSGSWQLVDVYRDTTRRRGHSINLDLTEAAKNAIIRRMSDF